MIGSLVLLSLVAVAAAASSQQLPPSFVILLADDMGWGDWSLTGAPAHTPHLEVMAKSKHAVWFKRSYSGNPICSPTRASLLTGRTPSRSCIHGVEQQSLCHAGICPGSEYGIANATRDAAADYISGFYGKWHLGSLSDRGKFSPDCYPKPANVSCLLGYWEKDGGCCFGIDGPTLPVSHPLQFGFDEFVATPECAASATSNCGCFWHPTPHNDTPCELGHYDTPDRGVPYSECMQYYVGNRTGVGEGAVIEPVDYVTPVDDQDFLVDQFADLLRRSVAAERPFLALIFFHGVHIPYIATPESRKRYAALGMNSNEQDYWGTVTQIDSAVGKVRALLRSHGVENRTFVSINADNGPEVSPSGGQGTASFANPGLTGGLRGRKRDVTEGGTRVIGLVEYPPGVPAKEGGRVEELYPVVTSDYVATVQDLVGVPAFRGRPLDGVSLLPALRGAQAVRPSGIGIHGSFPLGDTNHVVDEHGSYRFPHRCPNSSASEKLGDVPAHFASVAGGGSQISWTMGNDLKLVGCNGKCNGTNCNSTSPGFSNKGWRFFLYNVTRDRAEVHDLWSVMRGAGLEMLRELAEWQASVLNSQENETKCKS